jgi:hypothetical protein
MKLRTKNVIVAAAAVPIILLLMGQHAQAYWGDGNGWIGGESGYQPDAYNNGYFAGQQDAIYDHDNNLAYNPIGECLPCHSELYWSNFHAGYDHQWNSYQVQESTQRTSINIYGNNNYVNTAQYSGQNQQGSDFNPPNCWGHRDGGPDP